MTGALVRALTALCAPGGARGRLAVLLYHRVLAAPDPVNDWDVTAAEFAQQMRALRAWFNPLPLSEALARLAAGSLPPRAVSVTFDDGYADNADVALPILLRAQVPATFFIATGFLNGGRMWNDTVGEAIRAWPDPTLDAGFGALDVATADSKRAAIKATLGHWKYLPATERAARTEALAASARISPASALMMSDHNVKTLREAGMEIGAHTVTHPILAMADPATAMREIGDSRTYLEDLLREPVTLFAYPNGRPDADYGAREIAAVRAAGFAAAVSTAPGVATADADAFQIPRFTPWDRAAARFSLRLAAQYRHASPAVAALT